MHDTFISYRRDGGSEIAARIYDYLRLKKFNPFYDIVSMRMGRFDEQLRERLVQSENYILVLSKGALDRCNNEEDWLRMEIKTAIDYNLNIIVLKDECFEYPAELPEDIELITKYQTLDYNNKSINQVIDSLPALMKYSQELDYSAGDVIPNKIKIAGTYITQYEDFIREKVVIRKAPAILHTFGNKLWGTTWFGSKQKWKITGRIYGKKRIAGIYRANGVLDAGFGTFYLELNQDNTLEGFWSGYDNANNAVTTGRYVFKRQLENFKLRFATIEDFASIISIADAQLGKDYVTEDFLNEIIDNGKSTFCKVLYNTKNDKIVGFCICKKIIREDLPSIVGDTKIKELLFEKEIGFIKTIAIDSAYKNQGFGSILIQESIKQLEKLGVSRFVSTAWKHAGIINIGSILERFGFVKHTELPNYWYESSIKEGFNCPQCGNPCHCSCVIYVKI